MPDFVRGQSERGIRLGLLAHVLVLGFIPVVLVVCVSPTTLQPKSHSRAGTEVVTHKASLAFRLASVIRPLVGDVR